MTATVSKHRTQTLPAIRQIEKLLSGSAPLKLRSDEGAEIELPAELRDALTKAVRLIASGDSIAVVSIKEELTTQEAADYLNISRPYLISLLEKGTIPFHKTGTHRRVNLEDVQNYRVTRDKVRRTALKQLTQESEELDLYGL